MVWGVPERSTEHMDVHMPMAEAVRQACLAAALQAYEEAGLSGLCHEGRWEGAVDAIRAMHSARWSTRCSTPQHTRRAEATRRRGPAR